MSAHRVVDIHDDDDDVMSVAAATPVGPTPPSGIAFAEHLEAQALVHGKQWGAELGGLH